MSIDQIARAAGAELRDEVLSTIDCGTHLNQLHSTVRRRRHLQLTAAAGALIAVAGGVGWLVASTLDRTEAPPTSPRPTTSQTQGTCDIVYFTCSPDGSIRADLPVAVTWSPTNTFKRQLEYEVNAAGNALLNVQADRRHAAASVVVLESAKPARPNRLASVDRTVPPNAQAYAAWVASRPYLVTSEVTQTKVDGRQAWTVDVRNAPTKRGQQLPYGCSGGYYRCTPIVRTGHAAVTIAGQMDGMLSRFTFVDVPGAGVTTIWSLTFDKPSDLTVNQDIVDTISFDAR